MDVRLKENEHQQVKNSLMSAVKTKDLSNVNELVDNSGSTDDVDNSFDSGEDSVEAAEHEEEEVKAARTVRFEYSGYVNMKPEILAPKEMAGDCLNHTKYSLDTKSSTSFHVVKTMDEFDENVLVRALILPAPSEDEEAVHCDIVSKDTQVLVMN